MPWFLLYKIAFLCPNFSPVCYYISTCPSHREVFAFRQNQLPLLSTTTAQTQPPIACPFKSTHCLNRVRRSHNKVLSQPCVSDLVEMRNGCMLKFNRLCMHRLTSKLSPCLLTLNAIQPCAVERVLVEWQHAGLFNGRNREGIATGIGADSKDGFLCP
jgi:hypothetical protein